MLSNIPPFLEINAPLNPLKTSFRLADFTLTPYNNYYVFDANEVLSADTVSFFQNLKLTPSLVAVFYKINGLPGIIHADIKKQNGAWVKNPAAVNWNLTGSDSIMTWHSMETEEYYPELNPQNTEKLPKWYFTLNGVHFGSRSNYRHESGTSHVIATKKIVTPTLVRTDWPHAVNNLDSSLKHLTLSLRFANELSWDEFFKVFNSPSAQV